MTTVCATHDDKVGIMTILFSVCINGLQTSIYEIVSSVIIISLFTFSILDIFEMQMYEDMIVIIDITFMGKLINIIIMHFDFLVQCNFVKILKFKIGKVMLMAFWHFFIIRIDELVMFFVDLTPNLTCTNDYKLYGPMWCQKAIGT